MKLECRICNQPKEVLEGVRGDMIGEQLYFGPCGGNSFFYVGRVQPRICYECIEKHVPKEDQETTIEALQKVRDHYEDLAADEIWDMISLAACDWCRKESHWTYDELEPYWNGYIMDPSKCNCHIQEIKSAFRKLVEVRFDNFVEYDMGIKDK